MHFTDGLQLNPALSALVHKYHSPEEILRKLIKYDKIAEFAKEMHFPCNSEWTKVHYDFSTRVVLAYHEKPASKLDKKFLQSVFSNKLITRLAMNIYGVEGLHREDLSMLEQTRCMIHKIGANTVSIHNFYEKRNKAFNTDCSIQVLTTENVSERQITISLYSIIIFNLIRQYDIESTSSSLHLDEKHTKLDEICKKIKELQNSRRYFELETSQWRQFSHLEKFKIQSTTFPALKAAASAAE